MEKSAILISINETVATCEALATTSARNNEYMDVLGEAIDCADAGLMLIMKMPNDHLPRTLIKQYIVMCEDLAKHCKKYEGTEIETVVSNCGKSAEICTKYLEEDLHPDHYFLNPLAIMPKMTA